MCCQVFWPVPGHTGPAAPAAPPPWVLPVLPDNSSVRIRALRTHQNRADRPATRGSPLMSTFPAMSMAVVKSHIWMLPLLWPLKRYRRGREPMRLEPSHSWTMKAVMEVPSTERTSHTLRTHTLQLQSHTKETGTSRVLSPLPVGREPDIQFIGVWDDSLDEDLLVVSLPIRTWDTGTQGGVKLRLS